jgi:hypothetical protein
MAQRPVIPEWESNHRLLAPTHGQVPAQELLNRCSTQRTLTQPAAEVLDDMNTIPHTAGRVSVAHQVISVSPEDWPKTIA